jgi:hypothetical protein
MVNFYRYRFALIAVAGISLLSALWAGLIRLGWSMPVLSEVLPSSHGALMVVGFLGTLIGLERAVALNRLWPFGVPVTSGSASLFALAGFPNPTGAILAVTASCLLIAVFVSLHRQQPSGHFVVMGLSAFAWLAGNLLWLADFPLFVAVPWWVGFLVLMIAGERLELSRLMRVSFFGRTLFYLSVAVVVLGLVVSLYGFQIGIRIAGAGWLALAFWLLAYDIAWRTARQPGLPRYMATCLLTGYFWLGAGGLLWLIFAPFFHTGPRYDAMLHAIFLGFVFSMIFAHAPIIFPSITGLALPFRKLFYLHAALLHLSLLLRVVGDLILSPPVQRWGGLLNTLAVLLFLLNNVHAVKSARAKNFVSRQVHRR